jgi:transcriptional regulator with XRE-family HTH domain
MPRVPRDTLAVRLIVVRHEMGWSQREAAEHTGVPYGVWQGMESGRETRGLDQHIDKIARVTGYKRDWLMWGGPLGHTGPPPVDDPAGGGAGGLVDPGEDETGSDPVTKGNLYPLAA